MPSGVIVKQMAQNFKNDDEVELTMEDLRLFSNGIFSNVYKGFLTRPMRRTVAVKKSWSNTSGRQRPLEVQILSALNRFHHKNIVELLFIFNKTYPDGRTCTSLVFEFFPQNLHDVRQKYGPLCSLDIKIYVWQLFRGQAHLEKHHVCHRDIKPQNLLVDHMTGQLKISDFGSSKVLSGRVTSYHYHVTRYYRAPELIMGSTYYRCEIDRWSCGCVFGELLKNKVLLPGKSSTHQLQLIIDILGYPTDEDVSKMRCTKAVLGTSEFHKYTHKEPALGGFQSIVKTKDPEALDLLNRVLVYDPNERVYGPVFLNDRYFRELFDSNVRRNGQPLTILTREDLEEAISGDVFHPESRRSNISEDAE